MCHVTGELTESLEQCKELERRLEEKKNSASYPYILHAISLLKMAQISSYSQQFKILNEIFAVIQKILPNAVPPSFFKVAADALMMASKFNEETFKLFLFPQSWQLASPSGAVDMAVQFYCKILTLRSDKAAAWNDLGIALLRKYSVTSDSSLRPR